MTSLLLRADASPTIGVGHLSRCVALATAARARGWDVALCGTFTAGDWLIGDLPVVPTLRPADAVVIDHYGLGDVSLPSLVVSLEDGHFGRRRADIVVDANLAVSDRPADGSPVVLRGPAYAPLRAEIRAARLSRTPGSTPPKIVVVMGGGATPSAVAAAVTALRETGLPATVQAISATPVPGIEVLRPTPTLPTLFAEADLVISAAGVTLMELCCIGVPTALVQIADNQAAGYKAAVTQGLAAGLGTNPRKHIETLRSLLLAPEQRKPLGEKAMAVVDGRGTDRILDTIHTELSTGSTVIHSQPN
jgi:spore coat polysaccharide biosynthesis predicted glycosyltransferase SpsG